MSDIKIFRFDSKGVKELKPHSVEIEKKLQNQIEKNLETFLSVRFLSSEYSTGKTHGGRIDTLGIDEDGSPVIIEYKRALNQNVINQGLYYLDWLLDHRAEFKLLVMEKLGKKEADEIDWAGTRMLCIAGDFTKYDEYAIKQMGRNIELIKFKYFEDDLLLLERVNAGSSVSTKGNEPGMPRKMASEYLEGASESLRDLFDDLSEYCQNLGEDVVVNKTSRYIAFKRYKNFVYVKARPSQDKLWIAVRGDIKSFPCIGDIKQYKKSYIATFISSSEDLNRAKPLILASYGDS